MTSRAQTARLLQTEQRRAQIEDLREPVDQKALYLGAGFLWSTAESIVAAVLEAEFQRMKEELENRGRRLFGSLVITSEPKSGWCAKEARRSRGRLNVTTP